MAHPKIEIAGTIGNGADQLTREEHMILASERRYLLIDIMRTASGPFDLEELANALASREDGVDPNDRRTLEIICADLHHVHLPKMDDVGVIEYDIASHQVYPIDLPR